MIVHAMLISLQQFISYNFNRPTVHGRVSKGWDVPQDVPGQSGMGRPIVPGEKYFLVLLSLCPGTWAGAKIPGQIPLSRDVPEQNHFPKKQEKDILKQEKDVLKQERMF
jgi:hypothetical protein